MGFFKKIFKGIKKVFKKIGKFIKKQFKRIGKVFGKLGIVGTIALAIIAPYALPALASFAGTAAASANMFVSGFGKLLGAGLKVVSGVGKVVGSVGKAISNTLSRVVGKVGGEFLRKIGIDNFMGKDLTKLDSWGTIWEKTQADFAGIKNAWSTGTKAFQEQFDIAKANKQAETRSLLDVDEIGSATDAAVREGAYTDPTRFGEQGDYLSGPYTPAEQGNYITDPITGEITVKPAMTPVEKVDIFSPDTEWVPIEGTLDPTTGKPYMKAVGPSAGFDPALNPTVMSPEGKSLLVKPDYMGGDNVTTIDPQLGPYPEVTPARTEVATAPRVRMVEPPVAASRGPSIGDFGRELYEEGKSRIKGAIKDSLFGQDSTEVQEGGYPPPGIAPTLPYVPVQPGTQVTAVGISVDPTSDWARAMAAAIGSSTATIPLPGAPRVMRGAQ